MIEDLKLSELPLLPSNLEETDLVYGARGGVSYRILGSELQGMTPVNTRTQLIPVESSTNMLNSGDVVTYIGDDDVDDLPIVDRISDSNTQVVAGIVNGGSIPPNSNGSVYLRGRLPVSLDAGTVNENGQPGDPIYVTQGTGRLTLAKTSRTRVGTILATNGGPTDYIIYADCRNNLQADVPYIVVNSLEDLPPPNAGIISLQTAVYLIQGTVNIGNNRLQGTTGVFLLGVEEGASFLTSTLNTGQPLISTTGGDCTISNLTISAPVSGDTVNFAGNAGVNSIRIFNTSINGFTGARGIVIEDVANAEFLNVDITGVDDGLVVSGSNNGTIRWIGASASMAANGTYISLGASVSRNITLTNLDFDGVSGQTILSGVANSANLGLDSAGLVANCLFGESGIVFTNINETDIRWFFSNNRGIPNTRAFGKLVMDNNFSVTSIPGAGIYVGIAGVATLSNPSQISSPANQLLEYDGLERRRFLITVSISVLAIGGAGNRLGGVRVVRNGVPIIGNGSYLLNNTFITTGSFNGITEGVQGDIFQVQIANFSDANNIRVDDCQFSLTEI